MHAMVSPRFLVSVLLSLPSGSASSAQPIAVGGEFRVNSYTTADQERPDVAMDAQGNFVVVWHSDPLEPFGLNVKAQRFDAAGGAIGGEFQVNSYTTFYQANPAVAMGAQGDFVVVWDSGYWTSPGPDGDSWGVQGQLYDATGNPRGSEFQVNTNTVYEQRYAKAAMAPDGSFVVVWQDGALQGVPDVRAQRFDSNGDRLGRELQASAALQGESPAIALGGQGDFVVVWHTDPYGGDSSIQVRRFDSSGSPIGEIFQVNSIKTGIQLGASVAMDEAGRFVVSWSSRSYLARGGGDSDIRAQRLDSEVHPIGGEFQFNTYTTHGQVDSAVRTTPGGGFLAVWRSDGQDGDAKSVHGQHYDPLGDPAGGEFQVNIYTTLWQTSPGLARVLAATSWWSGRAGRSGAAPPDMARTGPATASRGSGTEAPGSNSTASNPGIPPPGRGPYRDRDLGRWAARRRAGIEWSKRRFASRSPGRPSLSGGLRALPGGRVAHRVSRGGRRGSGRQ